MLKRFAVELRSQSWIRNCKRMRLQLAAKSRQWLCRFNCRWKTVPYFWSSHSEDPVAIGKPHRLSLIAVVAVSTLEVWPEWAPRSQVRWELITWLASGQPLYGSDRRTLRLSKCRVRMARSAKIPRFRAEEDGRISSDLIVIGGWCKSCNWRHFVVVVH